jgi:peroxiredoxin
MNMTTVTSTARRMSWLAVATVLLTTSCARRDRANAVDTTFGRSNAFRPLDIGSRLPRFTITTLSGDTITLGGTSPPTILNVWATWCTSCREEMADLEALQRDLSPRGVRVVGVSVDVGNGARVRQFAAHERLTFIVAHDPAQRVQQLCRIVGVPETLVIGADGRLLWRWVGNLHPVIDSVRRVVTTATS